MISPISGYNPSTYGIYGSYYANRAAQALGANRAAQAQTADKAAQSAQRPEMVATARKVAQPETPVQPVTPVRSISTEDPAQAGLLRFASDPAEMAVRMRIQYPGDAQQSNALQPADGSETQAPVLPGAKNDSAQPAGNEKAQVPLPPGAKDDSNSNAAQAANADKANQPQMPDLPGAKSADEANPAVSESKSAQEVMEEGECQTCKERKYQDGSDDPGVSFKTPTNISPDQAAAAVRGHENEHVVREQSKAQRENRKVVSQSVSYSTDICPECGKAYVSGGTTRTVTKANTDQQAQQQQQDQQNQQGQKNNNMPVGLV